MECGVIAILHKCLKDISKRKSFCVFVIESRLALIASVMSVINEIQVSDRVTKCTHLMLCPFH